MLCVVRVCLFCFVFLGFFLVLFCVYSVFVFSFFVYALFCFSGFCFLSLSVVYTLAPKKALVYFIHTFQAYMV